MVKIYALKDPITNEIRYIGKTVSSLDRRLRGHVCNRVMSGRSYLGNWIKSLYNKNLKPVISLIEECEDNIWEEREKYWIRTMRQDGVRLVNFTQGGEVGCLGYKHTDEAKKRISLLNSRPKSLSWIQNAAQAVRTARSTPICQYDMQRNLIKEWDSICYAADSLGDTTRAKVKNIHSCCNNKRKSAYGFIWRYKGTES